MQQQADPLPSESPVRWQACATDLYRRSITAQRAALAATLAAQLRSLTGLRLAAAGIAVDDHGRYATARVDNQVFRRYRHGLVLVRPCAVCAGGFTESPVIDTQPDLGYALAVWYPSHEHADDAAPADLGDW